MSAKTVFDLGFRVYAIGVGLLGIVTALLAFGYVTVSTTILGSLWLGAAALGGAIVLGLTLDTDHIVEVDRDTARCERWDECMFTGWLLNIYLITAAIWAGASFGWFIGGQAAAGVPVVGYGWIAIAVYGAVVATGITATHYDFLAEAVNPTADVEP
jgi:hypothetical protein